MEKIEEKRSFFLSDYEKKAFVNALMPELALLRAKAEVSQEQIANLIGVSRQTYGAIERGSRKMSWSTYLALILFYDYNRKTHKIIRKLSAFPHTLIKRFNDGDEPLDLELGLLFKSDTENILSSLDEQAMSTIKTVFMVEYSRCSHMSSDAVVKMFEGLEFSNSEVSKDKEETMKALKNLKEQN